jgi:mutator family transposase
MKLRGLNDPLLVTSDGAPGIIKAIEVCFPRAARQRYLAHRMRNLAAKLPRTYGRSLRPRRRRRTKPPAGRSHASSPPAWWLTTAKITSARLHVLWTTSKLHCPPAIPSDASPRHPDHQPSRAPVCRGASTAQDHSQCLRRTSCLGRSRRLMPRVHAPGRNVMVQPSGITGEREPAYRVVIATETGEVELDAAWRKTSDRGAHCLIMLPPFWRAASGSGRKPAPSPLPPGRRDPLPGASRSRVAALRV